MIFNFLDFENFIRQEELPELMIGDANDSVIILQNKLKMLGFYNGSITGSFGESTKEAVILFQEQYGLNPSGIVDSNTWEELYNLTDITGFGLTKAIKPTLKLGSRGEDVITLQTRLSELMYYDGPIDGIFGKATEDAVKIFQTNNKLTSDGIVGRNTWAALETLYSPVAICNNESTIPNTITYIVVSNDTLYSIAKRYNTTVNDIKKLNNLTSDIINVGQKLLIPSTQTSSNITYTVVPNDTLYSIANKYNTTVNDIKTLNNLTSDIINVGQKLLIPTYPTSNIVYTVIKGDTLYSIAKKYNTTVNNIKTLNNLTSDNLSIGQKLIISK